MKESPNPILNLLFARKPVRFVPREPEPWLFRVDVAEALALDDRTRSFDTMPRKWVETVTVPVVSARVNDAGTSGRKTRARDTQKVVIISPAGAMFLAFRSRSPEALAFVDWLLEQVLPEVAKYGVYVAGADPAEKCTLLWHRWREERHREIQTANAVLAENGLQTIAMFRELNQVELRDVLSFARNAAQCAMEAREDRTRAYTSKGMRRAYSEAVLKAALLRMQPQLPWPEEAAAKVA